MATRALNPSAAHTSITRSVVRGPIRVRVDIHIEAAYAARAWLVVVARNTKLSLAVTSKYRDGRTPVISKLMFEPGSRLSKVCGLLKPYASIDLFESLW